MAPRSGAGSAPILLPTVNAEMRRQLDRWFDEKGYSPRFVGEFDDRALIKEFSQAGAGVFPFASTILPEVQRQYNVELVGTLSELQLQFYAITLKRKLTTHPPLVAISEAAKQGLFATGQEL